MASTQHSIAAVLISSIFASLTIIWHVLIHRDVGGWVAKGNVRDTSVLEGHLVEWEWSHLGEAVRLFESPTGALTTISSQNLYRFTGGMLVALSRWPGAGIYDAAVLATALAWLASCVALFFLARKATGSAVAGMVGCLFVANGTGFVGFIGNVDAHPFGYASLAIWMAAVEQGHLLSLWRWTPATWPRDLIRPVLAGLSLVLVAYTMEPGYVLLPWSILAYWLPALFRGVSVRRAAIALASYVAAFIVPVAGFRLLASRVLFDEVVPFNRLDDYLVQAGTALLSGSGGLWVIGRLQDVIVRWIAAFPPVITLLAIVGLFFASPRWRWWALVFIVGIVSGTMITRPFVRDLYFAHPGVYVLASVGTIKLAQSGASRLPVTARRPVLVVLASVAILAVAWEVNADLRGNYTLPVRWFEVQ